MYISFLKVHINSCIVTSARQALPKMKPCYGGVCVCPICKDVKLRFGLSLVMQGVEQACRAPLNKALCSVLRISLETSSDVPALL